MAELTDIERLILSNQYKILSSLDNKMSNHYSIASEVFRRGYSNLYDDYLSMSIPLSKEESNLAYGVLNLYRELNNSYLSLKDKKSISKQDVAFPGFDADDSKESRLLSFSKFIVDTSGDYEMIKENLGGDPWVSHMPILDKYIKMIEIEKSAFKPIHGYLSPDQIKEILSVLRK